MEAGMIDSMKKKADDVLNFMSMAVQGVYYDAQAARIGVDPEDPQAEKEIEKRLKNIQDMSVEDYMAVTSTSGPNSGGTGSLGVNAAKKQNQERALKDLLDFYTRKNELKKAKAK